MHRHHSTYSVTAPLITALLAALAFAQPQVPLIPRDVLFGNPDKASPQISPDGTKLAYLAPTDGVMNVCVGPIDDPSAAKPVTRDTKRGIRSYFWAFTNEHIVYTQDEGGDENWRVYCTDITGGQTRDLTPFNSISGPDGLPIKGPDGQPIRPSARIQEVSHRFPSEILIAINNRNPQLHDIHRVNITTGSIELVETNDKNALGYLTDDNYVVRMAIRPTRDGGNEILKRSSAGEWSTFTTIPQDDALTSTPEGFSENGEVLFMRDSRGRNTSALTAVNLADNASKTLAEDPKADAVAVMRHPTTGEVQAVAFEYERENWAALDKTVESDFAKLRKIADGDFSITSRTLDDRQWIVAFEMDNGPARFYRFDRKSGDAKFLFSNRSKLEGLPLAKMRTAVIKARDGMNLVSYLTLPTTVELDATGKPKQAPPLVLLVHGGPWARDSWGYNASHQWLANRGYAVLSVNFRGSTGFGKTFVNAANREWAAKMHDDLLDAVGWARTNGFCDERVAIMGGSYGGYATLVGLTFTPEVFTCGVSIVGPSNLVTLLQSIPPYWAPLIETFSARVGDVRTEEGRKFLAERSPLTHVAKIQRPLLIGQGANDPRVKQAEADQIVTAMRDKNIPVTYVLYPDEGHGFQRPENRMSFNAVTEAFLARHLGGRAEPIGDDFKGATISVPAGSDQVPSLSEALR